MTMPMTRTPLPHPNGAGQRKDSDATPDAGIQQGRVDSAELLRGQKTVEISHNGSTYRLQATRLGKLILTK